MKKIMRVLNLSFHLSWANKFIQPRVASRFPVIPGGH
jgi:hypothetical protein